MPDDIDGQEFTSEVQEPAAAPETGQENHSTDTTSEPNPFWGEVEKKVGPNVYKLIQPDLVKADSEARNRISAVNQSYAPWKAFADRGIEPQHVEQALGVVQRLNSSPEQVFASLQEFLEREGRMPSKQELTQEVIEDEQEEEDPVKGQLTQLEEQQRKIAEYLQNQQFQAEQAQAAREADSWLDSETSRLTSKGYDQADLKEIVRIAAFQAQSTGQDPDNLDAAAAQYDALRDRIRTAPRPGQLAPRLPSGPGGGTPSQGNIDPSNMTKAQRLELVANTLQRGRQA